MKNLILGFLVLTILSGCGVRKVQTNKSATEIKETSVQAIKIDSTATNVVKKDVEEVIIEDEEVDGEDTGFVGSRPTDRERNKKRK